MLILGGARSGKSSCATRIANDCFRSPVLLATAEALDAEMTSRIRQHVADRPAHWTCIEEPIDLAAAYARIPSTCDGVVLDCLTLWASNVLIRDGGLDATTSAAADRALQLRLDAFWAAVSADPRPLIMVSNEVGLGIVPPTPLGRLFRDESGRMNQLLAARVDEVVFVVSGLEMVLKGRRDEWKR